MERLPYRPDLDGLRALSVLAVIFFHFSVPGFSGGFVGVDVFFVISGYLITQLLVLRSDLPLRQWLADFYLRRARRILPALLLMLIVSCVFAWWLFAPQEFTTFGESLALSVAMLGNQAARRIGGYFDTPWTSTPLLHLWSIAIEEQFYLAYPAALFAVLRFAPRHWSVALLAAGTVASFALCVALADTHPAANYYLALSRAWELGLGALLGVGASPWKPARSLRELLAAAALAAILVPAVYYDSLTPFPGWYALPVCLGALVLIAMAPIGGSLVNRFLALPPLAFIGLISYALYLWHMPIKVFRDYYMVTPPGRLELSAELVMLCTIAFASWQWLEVPVRKRKLLSSNRTFLATSGVIACALFAVGYYVWHSDGLPRRLESGERRMLDTTRFTDRAALACLPPPLDRVAAGDLCRFGASYSPHKVVLLWGDSHALMLLPAVRAAAERRGMQVQFAGRSSCPPIVGAPGSSRDAQQRCEAFNVAMTQAVAKINPRLIILAAFWADPGNRPPTPIPSDTVGPDAAFGADLRKTLRQVAGDGRKICLVRDVPRFRYRVAHALAMAKRRGIDPTFNVLTLSEARDQQRLFDAQFDQLDAERSTVSVNLREKLCASGTCLELDETGLPLYRDESHLTDIGARLVEPQIEGCFDDHLAPPTTP